MAKYFGRAKNVYVVEYPQGVNVPSLRYQLERLEIRGLPLKTAGLSLEYQFGLATLRIFVTPLVEELRHGRLFHRAEFLLLSSSNSPYEATDMENSLNSIVEEVNSKLNGIQLESLGAFWERERTSKREFMNLVAILKDFFSSRLFVGSVLAGLVIFVYLALSMN